MKLMVLGVCSHSSLTNQQTRREEEEHRTQHKAITAAEKKGYGIMEHGVHSEEET